ncbi:hypothetical protein ACFOY2_02985 [Nonomuraea purpurea]|uniref:Uncharacterized protein n=1 Tax=Nonomuraea purpurea TaxID=1849276 RepID=A0ABV8FWQ0_9ACTN
MEGASDLDHHAGEHLFACGYEEDNAVGRIENAVEVLLLVLVARGLDVTADVLARITACTDLAQLHAWGACALTAETIQDLFSEPGGQDR